jgi:hypothetical protein
VRTTVCISFITIAKKILKMSKDRFENIAMEKLSLEPSLRQTRLSPALKMIVSAPEKNQSDDSSGLSYTTNVYRT